MKNNNHKQGGFTLIELLVVIAIIGILATIVLTSLGSARGKATDAKVQAQLSSMRAQAELFYNTGGNYGVSVGLASPCDTSNAGSLFIAGTNTINQLITAIPGGYTTACVSTGSAWAFSAMNGNSPATGWCVDSNGQSKTTQSATSASALITGSSCV